jgi:hypothetical protein
VTPACTTTVPSTGEITGFGSRRLALGRERLRAGLGRRLRQRRADGVSVGSVASVLGATVADGAAGAVAVAPGGTVSVGAGLVEVAPGSVGTAVAPGGGGAGRGRVRRDGV